ncbi:hypothetical protein [Syntrophothermus sp.]|nr:hypothetical protein [Syntrophothermus sp.]
MPAIFINLENSEESREEPCFGYVILKIEALLSLKKEVSENDQSE